ncbi:MAG TPA: copper oxidase [Dissulfurispiraceae bacterium]|nr:copper oxidase [Dissulfurispiraceae bacterium]
MKRRDFLQNSFLAFGALAFADKASASAVSRQGHAAAHIQKTHAMPDPVGWADPVLQLSPPPPLMGRQMGRVITPNVRPLGYELAGRIKVYKLVVQPVEHFLLGDEPPAGSIWANVHQAKGIMHHEHLSKKARVWGFNGSMPGPTIESYEGDRVRIVVKNELPEPTTIHWHGIELPHAMDGVGGVTQPPIQPGETFVYEFTLYQHGTFMYHSSFNEKKQVGMGVGGFFIVHPKSGGEKIDRDFAIMLQEWKLLPGNQNPDITSTEPNWFTFNGKSAPSTDILTVNQWDRVRIRFANLSNHNSHPIHLHGVTWKVVGTEGGPVPPSAQWPGNTVDVPPGTIRDVAFTAWNPGLWHFHCHKLHHTVNAHADAPMGVMPMGGMTSFLHVVPPGKNALWRHPKQGGGQ